MSSLVLVAEEPGAEIPTKISIEHTDAIFQPEGVASISTQEGYPSRARIHLASGEQIERQLWETPADYKPVLIMPNYLVFDAVIWIDGSAVHGLGAVELYPEEGLMGLIDFSMWPGFEVMWKQGERTEIIGNDGDWVYGFQSFPGILFGFNPHSGEIWSNDEVEARQYLGKTEDGAGEVLLLGSFYRSLGEALFSGLTDFGQITTLRDEYSAQVLKTETPEPIENPQVVFIRPNLESGKGEVLDIIPISSSGRVRGVYNSEIGKIVVAAPEGVWLINAKTREIEPLVDGPLGQPLYVENWDNLVVVQTEAGELLVLRP